MIPASDTPQPDILLELLNRIESKKICKWGESERDSIFHEIEVLRSRAPITPQPDTGKQPEREYRVTQQDLVDFIRLKYKKERAEKANNIVRRSAPITSPPEQCCLTCPNVPCKPLNRIPCTHIPQNPCIENGCTDTENCDEICEHSRIYSPAWVKQHDAALIQRKKWLVIYEMDDYEPAIHEHDNEIDARRDWEDGKENRAGPKCIAVVMEELP